MSMPLCLEKEIGKMGKEKKHKEGDCTLRKIAGVVYISRFISTSDCNDVRLFLHFNKNWKIWANLRPVLLRQGEPGTPQYIPRQIFFSECHKSKQVTCTSKMGPEKEICNRFLRQPPCHSKAKQSKCTRGAVPLGNSVYFTLELVWTFSMWSKWPPCNDLCPIHWWPIPLIHLFSCTLM